MKRREFITLLPQSQLVSSQSANRAGTSLRPLARHLAPVIEASTSVADSVPYHYYLLLYRACRRRCAMPFAPLNNTASGVTPVAFGCGPGRTRGPYGGCIPMGYGVAGPRVYGAYGAPHPYAHRYGYHPYYRRY